MFNQFFKKFTDASEAKRLTDPICGMHANEKISFEYKGQTYFFCSDHCRQQFQKEPERYIV